MGRRVDGLRVDANVDVLGVEGGHGGVRSEVNGMEMGMRGLQGMRGKVCRRVHVGRELDGWSMKQSVVLGAGLDKDGRREEDSDERWAKSTAD
jgi:hypothetical protein